MNIYGLSEFAYLEINTTVSKVVHMCVCVQKMAFYLDKNPTEHGKINSRDLPELQRFCAFFEFSKIGTRRDNP